MKKIFMAGCALLFINLAVASEPQVYKKHGFELTFSSNDPALDTVEKQRLINTFFEVYPKLAKEYNKHTAWQVVFFIDTAYKGVAETNDAKVRISAKWMHSHPEDIDVVTHEVMHIVQDYKESVGPWWLTEGIADFARNKFGVNNTAANWSLPAFKASQYYENGYRITARFLLWAEEKIKPGLVKHLNEQLRKHTYTESSWQQQTGKTLDELWKEYASQPQV